MHFFYVGKGQSEHLQTCGQPFAGTMHLTFARTTRRQVFVALVTAVSFYTTAVITNMAGSWRGTGKRETTIAKTLISMRLTVMMRMSYHLHALYAENLSKTQWSPSVSTISVRLVP